MVQEPLFHQNFCDIHTHVLYGLDDGSRELSVSLEMLALAARHGTTDLVATPHSDLRFRYDVAKVDQQIAELSKHTGGTLRLYRGCDFHMSFDNISDAMRHPRKYTLNSQECLLIEFPHQSIAANTSDLLQNLLGAGMRPVITHPERNPAIRERLGDLMDWIEAGAFVQVTAQSFLGRFGRRAATFSWELLRRGLIHFIASDAHDTSHRPPVLDQCYKIVASQSSPMVADLLFRTNGIAALHGRPIQKPAAMAPRWFGLAR